MTTSVLHTLVSRAFPAREALRTLALDQYLVSAWKQLATAAGVDKWALASVIAKELGLEAPGGLKTSDPFAAQLLPESLAREHFVLPLREESGALIVACAAPHDENALQRVKFVTNRALKVLVVPPDELEWAIVDAYARLSQLLANEIGTIFWTADGKSAGKDATGEHALVQLARSLLMEAIKERASDIHMQPFSGGGLVRIRVDGVLQRLAFLPGAVLQALLRYFKAHGGMDPTNDRVPQDGRMSLVLGSHDYDLRLSVLPASHGERLVIRFLDQSRVYKLSGAGLSTAAMQSLRKLGANSSGVVLITGPTGSGKTSTLHAMLVEINRTGVSIITVENPVEYRVAGISQVEVNAKAGLTFATALRSILRQDPDIILIGEIRDSETADIAMQAALTGHLVLSTLHTNDALTAIPRLIDLGVHPSILADALAGVVAQRLFRKLCVACRVSVNEPLRKDERLFHELTGERPAYRAVGCGACRGTGYSGRQPVTEIVEMSPALRRLLAVGHTDTAKLMDMTQGPLSSLSHGAAMRVISGDTTADEAARVVGQRFWSDLSRDFGRTLPVSAVSALTQDEGHQTSVSVLLFEKHSATRTAVTDLLAKASIKVHTADDPSAARDIVEKDENVALLVADIDVGTERENLDALLRLRRALAWSRLPVMLILPAEQNATQQMVKDHGVSDYLVKPVTSETIVARIQAMLVR